MEDGLAQREVTENLTKKNQNVERARELIESMAIPFEDFAEYERMNWAGWNG